MNPSGISDTVGSMVRSLRGLAVAASFGSVMLASPLAFADDAAAAQALFDRAVELMQEKKFDEACPKLEEVTRLIPDGNGAKLTLAECYESQGKTASAWTQYVFVQTAAARSGQTDRAQLATEKAAALKPKLARLTIKVPDAVKQLPSLSVTRGGVAVGAAQYGEAIPIDVGSHVVEVKAPGKKPWKQEVKVPADGAQLAVDVPELEDDPNATAEPEGNGTAPGTAPASKPTWLFPAGFIVGGVGVAALAAGGALGGLALSKSSEAEDECPRGFCSATGNELVAESGTFADVATGLFIGGGVLAAGGILMVILAPKGDDAQEPPTTGSIRWRFAPTALGAGIGGDF
ncbi:MAG: hypothetical protein HOW73_41650 [Polyangiaceae bacterium]|nr:hypothetical protein [Polyangiaceae bacterium]